MRTYLAGPMRGIDKWNFPAFREAAARLREQGHYVTSPHELDEDVGFTEDTVDLPNGFYAGAMRRYLDALLNVDAITFLPGFMRSAGCRIEAAVAEALGLDAFYLSVDYLMPMTWEAARHEFDCATSPTTTTEVRVTSATGGAKGSKPARFDMIPPDVLWELAEHYGRGEAKYPGDPDTGEANWQKGYAWSLSVAALQRHLYAWLNGEDTDPETGSSHLVPVMWHAMALRWWQLHGRGTDDLAGRSAAALIEEEPHE